MESIETLSLSKNISNLDFGPEPLNLSQIPQEILKANTIETLLAQNEDLMARLKVSIRRLDTYENDIKQVEEENQKLRHSYYAIKDQLLVYREKDNCWKEKIKEHETKVSAAQEQVEKYKMQTELAEMEFANIYTRFQSSQKEVDRLRRHREKLSITAHGMLKNLREEKQSFIQKLTLLEAQLASEISNNKRRTDEKDSLIYSLQNQIVNLTNNFKEQLKSLEVNRAEVVELYDNEKQLMLKEISTLREENQLLHERSQNYEKLYETINKLENTVVIAERTRDEIEVKLSDEIQRLQNKSIELHKQAAHDQFEANRIKRLFDDLEIKNVDLKLENEHLKEQMAALRQLWVDKSQQHDEVLKSNHALETLNAELSLKLNEARRN